MHAPIFHGRNHPRFSKIEILKAARWFSQPADIKGVHGWNPIVTDMGSSTGEDLDFNTESINQQSKSWITHGVPTSIQNH